MIEDSKNESGEQVMEEMLTVQRDMLKQTRENVNSVAIAQEYNRRFHALQCAVAFTVRANREDTDDVIETAERFLRWLEKRGSVC